MVFIALHLLSVAELLSSPSRALLYIVRGLLPRRYRVRDVCDPANSVRIGRAVIAEFNQPCFFFSFGRLHVGMIPEAAELCMAVALQVLLQTIVMPATVRLLPATIRLSKILCHL